MTNARLRGNLGARLAALIKNTVPGGRDFWRLSAVDPCLRSNTPEIALLIGEATGRALLPGSNGASQGTSNAAAFPILPFSHQTSFGPDRQTCRVGSPEGRAPIPLSHSGEL